jgi:hypothetical protein
MSVQVGSEIREVFRIQYHAYVLFLFRLLLSPIPDYNHSMGTQR